MCACQPWVAANTPDHHAVTASQSNDSLVERPGDGEDSGAEDCELVGVDARVDVGVKVEGGQARHVKSVRSSLAARWQRSSASRAGYDEGRLRVAASARPTPRSRNASTERSIDLPSRYCSSPGWDICVRYWVRSSSPAAAKAERRTMQPKQTPHW